MTSFLSVSESNYSMKYSFLKLTILSSEAIKSLIETSITASCSNTYSDYDRSFSSSIRLVIGPEYFCTCPGAKLIVSSESSTNST